MNVQEFLSEWETISKGNSGIGVDYQMQLLAHWVDIRKDIATQRAKNKFWADIFTSAVQSLREQLVKLVTSGKKDDPAVEALQEMLSKLEAAMEQHRTVHGNATS